MEGACGTAGAINTRMTHAAPVLACNPPSWHRFGLGCSVEALACAQLLAGTTPPTPPPFSLAQVWSRMIRNLLNASRRSGDFENARLLERLLLREAEAHASSQTSGSGRVVGALASARSETVRPSTGSTDAAPCEENALYLPYPGSSPDEDESAGGAGSEQMMLMSLEQMQALLQMLAGNGQLHATGGGNGAGANGPS